MGSHYSCLITEPILWAGPGMKHQTTSWGGFSTSWAQAHWPAWVIPNHPLWVFFPTKPPPKKNPTKNHVPLVFGQFSPNFPKFFYVINWSLDKNVGEVKKKIQQKWAPGCPKSLARVLFASLEISWKISSSQLCLPWRESLEEIHLGAQAMNFQLPFFLVKVKETSETSNT